jgi:uncharacterized protein
MSETSVILDTNIFVAAGFNRECTSRQLVDLVRSGQLRMVWSEATRGETRCVVQKIPRLSWEAIAELFRDADCYREPLADEPFAFISDRGDRKFAALAAATGATLVTNDRLLLDQHGTAALDVLSPAQFWQREHGRRESS